MLPLVAGGLILSLSWAVAWTSRSGIASRIGLPMLGMAMVALLIHVARGRPEAHFAVFAFLAVTVVYRHWLPVLSAAATIAVHHLSFNYFQAWGWGPVCFTEPSLTRVIEHALYVVAEAGILVMLAQRARADFRTAERLVDITHALLDTQGRIDLRVSRQTSSDPASGTLLEALRGIERAILLVRTSATQVGSASQEIASGNTDLSRRTEQQAATLEETAAASIPTPASGDHRIFFDTADKLALGNARRCDSLEELLATCKAETGLEPTYSMGDDIPIAPFGRTARERLGARQL